VATKKLSVTALSASSPLFNPDDLLSIEQLAARLRTDVAWVREKIRRRCPNPLPTYNLGRHLLFHWPAVCAWIVNSPRPVHAKHVRRKVKKPQTVKVAA
jgi:hypothetical protein